MPITEEQLASHWTESISRPVVRAGLESIFEQIQRDVAERSPACWASGRCCNFTRSGHRLYVTGLEAAYLINRIGSTEWAAAAPQSPARILRSSDLDEAAARGGCPCQLANLCGVHPIRPIGCRAYFCDRSAAVWQQDLTERSLITLRALHDQHHIEYRYGEWLGILSRFVAVPPESD